MHQKRGIHQIVALPQKDSCSSHFFRGSSRHLTTSGNQARQHTLAPCYGASCLATAVVHPSCEIDRSSTLPCGRDCSNWCFLCFWTWGLGHKTTQSCASPEAPPGQSGAQWVSCNHLILKVILQVCGCGRRCCSGWCVRSRSRRAGSCRWIRKGRCARHFGWHARCLRQRRSCCGFLADLLEKVTRFGKHLLFNLILGLLLCQPLGVCSPAGTLPRSVDVMQLRVKGIVGSTALAAKLVYHCDCFLALLTAHFWRRNCGNKVKNSFSPCLWLWHIMPLRFQIGEQLSCSFWNHAVHIDLLAGLQANHPIRGCGALLRQSFCANVGACGMSLVYTLSVPCCAAQQALNCAHSAAMCLWTSWSKAQRALVP